MDELNLNSHFPVQGRVHSRVLDPFQFESSPVQGPGPYLCQSTVQFSFQYTVPSMPGFWILSSPGSWILCSPVYASVQYPGSYPVQDLVQSRFRMSTAAPPFAQVIPCIFLFNWLTLFLPTNFLLQIKSAGSFLFKLKIFLKIN